VDTAASSNIAAGQSVIKSCSYKSLEKARKKAARPAPTLLGAHPSTPTALRSGTSLVVEQTVVGFDEEALDFQDAVG